MKQGEGDSPAKLTHPQHERMYAILRAIRDKPYLNASTFVKRFEVNRRTILRDIDYLRDRMHLPIEYDPKKRGYYLSEPIGGMPLLEVRESDLLWLFVGQHLLQQAGTDELAAQVRESFQRISALLGDTVSVQWERLSDLLSSKVSGLGAAEIKTFHAISEGLSRHLELRFDYRKTAGSPVERRHVRPLHSAFVNGQWYLFSHDLKREATRSFVFSRMSKVTVTEKSFDPAGLPGIPELLESGFGVKWSDQEAVTVRLRVSSEIAHLIGERTWHASQKITRRKDGSLMLQLKVNTFRELTNWICSWGPLMEVLEPQELRETVAKTLREAAEVYETSDSQRN